MHSPLVVGWLLRFSLTCVMLAPLGAAQAGPVSLKATGESSSTILPPAANLNGSPALSPSGSTGIMVVEYPERELLDPKLNVVLPANLPPEYYQQPEAPQKPEVTLVREEPLPLAQPAVGGFLPPDPFQLTLDAGTNLGSGLAASPAILPSGGSFSGGGGGGSGAAVGTGSSGGSTGGGNSGTANFNQGSDGNVGRGSSPPVVPEPATWMLFGAGALGLMGYARLRRRASS